MQPCSHLPVTKQVVVVHKLTKALSKSPPPSKRMRAQVEYLLVVGPLMVYTTLLLVIDGYVASRQLENVRHAPHSWERIILWCRLTFFPWYSLRASGDMWSIYRCNAITEASPHNSSPLQHSVHALGYCFNHFPFARVILDDHFFCQT